MNRLNWFVLYSDNQGDHTCLIRELCCLSLVLLASFRYSATFSSRAACSMRNCSVSLRIFCWSCVMACRMRWGSSDESSDPVCEPSTLQSAAWARPPSSLSIWNRGRECEVREIRLNYERDHWKVPFFFGHTKAVEHFRRRESGVPHCRQRWPKIIYLYNIISVEAVTQDVNSQCIIKWLSYHTV